MTMHYGSQANPRQKAAMDAAREQKKNAEQRDQSAHSHYVAPQFPGILSDDAFDFAFAKIYAPGPLNDQFGAELAKRLQTLQQAVAAAEKPLDPAISYSVTPKMAADQIVTETYWSVIAPAMASGLMNDMPAELADLKAVAASLAARGGSVPAERDRKAAAQMAPVAGGISTTTLLIGAVGAGALVYFLMRGSRA